MKAKAQVRRLAGLKAPLASAARRIDRQLEQRYPNLPQITDTWHKIKNPTASTAGTRLALSEAAQHGYQLAFDGNYHAAIELFEGLVELDPNDQSGWKGLLDTAFLHEKWIDFGRWLTHVEKRFPDDSHWWVALAGGAHERSGDTLSAEHYYRAAWEISKHADEPSFAGLVRLAANRQAWPEVLGLCESKPAGLSFDLETGYCLAFAFEMAGDWKRAQEQFEQQLETDPSSSEVMLGLSRCAVQLDDFQSADKHAIAAISDGGGIEAHLQLVAVHIEAGTGKRLRAKYERGEITGAPDTVSSVTRMLSSWLEDWPAVVDWVEKNPERRNQPDVLEDLGNAHIWLGDFQSAVDTFESLNERYPDDARGKAGLMRVAFNRFKLTAAADLASELWSEFRRLEDLEYVSICLLEASRYPDAKRCLDEAREWFGEWDDSGVVDLVAVDQLVTQFEFDTAFGILDNLTEHHPSPEVVQKALASTVELAARSQFHPDRLAAAVERLIEHPMRLSRESRLKLVRGLVALGMFDDAMAVLDDIPIEQREGSEDVLTLLAWKSTMQGDHEAAIAQIEKVVSRKYIRQIHAPIFNLELRRAPVEVLDGEPLVISAARDEILRVPAFLDHYRSMGISTFVFIDNGSTDGTYEFLLAQSDVILYYTEDDYVDAGLGMRWINHLIEELETINWCLFLDADELLIFPGYETLGITHLTDYLDRNGHNAVGSFMLDMHPHSLNGQAGLEPGDDLIEHSPYFTNTYDFQDFPISPYTDVRGGFRPTVLGERYRQMTKTPIVRSDSGVKFLSSSHETTPSIISDVRTALLHFKFVGDALTRSANEVEWTDYVYYAERNRVLERLRLQQEEEGDVDFSCPDMVRYTDSNQLVELGLISAPADYFP